MRNQPVADARGVFVVTGKLGAQGTASWIFTTGAANVFSRNARRTVRGFAESAQTPAAEGQQLECPVIGALSSPTREVSFVVTELSRRRQAAAGSPLKGALRYGFGGWSVAGLVSTREILVTFCMPDVSVLHTSFTRSPALTLLSASAAAGSTDNVICSEPVALVLSVFLTVMVFALASMETTSAANSFLSFDC